VLQEAIDFRDESDALFALLEPLDERAWERKTQFKDWTINDILAHLHLGNYLADLSLRDNDGFIALTGRTFAARAPGVSHLSLTHSWLDGIKHRALLSRWRDFYCELADHFVDADPKQRVRWVGPDMSVRSSITARLMETWAHGQAIYDLLGVERRDADRLKNIAVLGINTFGWTFANRRLEAPAERPTVRLQAPSGASWEWLGSGRANLIEGSATEFCQVVAQTRNVADTALKVTGETAIRWMSIAQCFAGPPEEPPPPGARFRQSG